ncbi:MAG: hypothetical protein NTX70_09200 [Verrucomicrobia bacterium]|nr:hypothetical protein [Verrucomicrobiota bacterium]
MRIDFDSAWKDTTEVYFPALLELFEPQMLPRVADHEPVSFLDQEMQELAHALGDDGRAEVDVGGDGTVAAGSESQPYHGSRRARRRARRSGRLRVDKLVRVPLQIGAQGAERDLGAGAAAAAAAGAGLGPGPGAAGANEKLAAAAGSISAAKSAARSSAKAKPAYWLAHIEVQTQRDSTLPRRLLDYHYHIERRHRCRVITFVILGDLSPSWRPGRFSSDVPPLGMSLGYLSLKLIDLEVKLESPRFRGNPVAMVVRAHLAALRTRNDLEARYTQRVALVRRLYEEGFSQKDVVFIHGLIDRLMILPRPLMIRFRQELFTIEKDKDMPYVDTLTRMSLQEGRQEGSLTQARESVIEALEIRFGEVSNDLRERITALDNLRALKAQHRRAITVPSLDQF